MDFFEMNFSTLFSDKHGKEIFNNIKKQIIQENKDTDIELIFKISYLDFFGLNNIAIRQLIESVMNQQVNVKKIKSTHKQSIAQIQVFLQDAINGINNEK